MTNYTGQKNGDTDERTRKAGSWRGKNMNNFLEKEVLFPQCKAKN